MADELLADLVPDDTNETGGPLTLAVIVRPTVDVVTTEVGWYAPDTAPGGAVHAGVFDVDTETTGDLLDSATFATITTPGWHWVALAVPLTAGLDYAIAVYTPDRWTRTVGLLSGASVPSTPDGLVTALQNGSPYGNGRFHEGGAGLIYPEDSFGSSWYGIALRVQEPGSEPEQGAAELTASGTLTTAARVIARGGANVQAAGTLTAAGRTVARATAALQGAGMLATAGRTVARAQVSLSAAGSMATAGRLVPRAAAQLAASGQLTVTLPGIVVEPGVLTAGGRPASTLASGGRPASTLTASGRP